MPGSVVVNATGATALRVERRMSCAAGEYHPHDGVEATIVDVLAPTPEPPPPPPAAHVSNGTTSALDWNVTVVSDAPFYWTAPIVSR